MEKLLAKEGNATKVPVHTYGEREREREKRKEKEKLQPWLEKFQLNSIWEFVMIPLHTTTAHEICCGNKSNHLDSIFDCLI